jgi:hypothetical protein
MSWFQELFGFPESVSAVKANFTVTETENSAILTSKVNNRSFNAGLFSIRNIESFSHVLSKPSTVPGTLNVVQGEGPCGSNSDICSVLESQSLPEFDGATFQAASNFNCLEFCSTNQTAEMGVTGYEWDQTQGPYCALAAGAATVYRNYFVPHSDGARGQLEKEIELLGKTPIGRFVRNGYPILKRADAYGALARECLFSYLLSAAFRSDFTHHNKLNHPKALSRLVDLASDWTQSERNTGFLPSSDSGFPLMKSIR